MSKTQLEMIKKGYSLDETGHTRYLSDELVQLQNENTALKILVTEWQNQYEEMKKDRDEWKQRVIDTYCNC